MPRVWARSKKFRRDPGKTGLAVVLLGSSLGSIMKFSIEVGEAEKHTIDFNFNQLLGKLVIQVNHQEFKRSLRLVDEPVRETHVIELGGVEDLTVRIEKERRQLVGSKCRVFLNDRLYKFYEGM